MIDDCELKNTYKMISFGLSLEKESIFIDGYKNPHK